MTSHSGPEPLAGSEFPLLVFDGGCLFCSHFAQLSELRRGIPDLRVCDGRADDDLRRHLAQRGYRLSEGAVLVLRDQVLHGAEAIQWLCARMTPSAGLLLLLAPWLATPSRARRFYPLLLLARRVALAVRGLPVDPDRCASPQRPERPVGERSDRGERRD